jgi:hypothetical protein
MLAYGILNGGTGGSLYAISGELSTIPEPTSLSLLAFGGVAMGLLRKLRRRRRPAP